MLLIIVILAGISGAIGQHLDKHLVNKGITRNDYFYYMCLSMIPFSIIMVIISMFFKDYVIRHGKTRLNDEKRFIGNINIVKTF